MNTKRLTDLMDACCVDGVVAISPEHFSYATGVVAPVLRFYRERLSIALFPKVGSPAIIICTTGEKLARDQSWIKDIRTYMEFEKSPTETLFELLDEKGLLGRRVAIELKYMCASDFQVLTKLAPRMTLIDATKLFRTMCMIKEREEIEILRHGASGTRKAIEAALLCARAGDTEKDLANTVSRNLFAVGADRIEALAARTGRNTFAFFRLPTEARLTKGDVVKVDCDAFWEGYFSDVARTAVVGRPTDRQRRLYEITVYAQRELIENAKVGVRACDLYQKAKETYERAGIVFDLSHVGHGLGTELHAEPILSPQNETLLEENMVFTIEPICRFPKEEDSYHVEDTVLVTSSEAEVLTGKTPDPEIPVID